MTHPDANERRDHIFGLIVESYIETADPVGSRTISKRYDLGLSPASIRNVMADLEEQGLLKQPHTSAGRVPTDRGYRYYVDCLMRPEPLETAEKEKIYREIAREKTVEGLAARAAKVISETTGAAALVYIRNLRRISFLSYLVEDLLKEAQRIQDLFEEESELFIDGTYRVIVQPEFRDAERMRALLEAFEQKYALLQVMVDGLKEAGLHVHIGRENGAVQLGDVSIVVKDCCLGAQPMGGVALVGPTRMRYPKNVAVVEFVADCLTEMARRF